MLNIRNMNTGDMQAVIDIVTANDTILAPNNKMIYYLCSTVFENFSFIAANEKQIVGFVCGFPDFVHQYIWIHQFAVHPDQKRRGTGLILLKHLEKATANCKFSIKKLKLAVKKDNFIAKHFYSKNDFHFLHFDEVIDMEIYQKILK